MKKVFIALMIIAILLPNIYVFATPTDTENTTNTVNTVDSENTQSSETSTNSGLGKIVVLDPGHGCTIDSEFDFSANGFIYKNGAWGEYRHWKSKKYGEECNGSECCGSCLEGRGEWFLAEDGNHFATDTYKAEAEYNFKNAVAAKKYLENKGYNVRMTRTDNSTHPSFAKRSTYCFPSNDTSRKPDADLYVCIHSNTGGSSGTAYISTGGGKYDQKYISSDYAEECDEAGETINNKIVEAGLFEKHGTGVINGQSDMIAFHKNPCVTAYLEIGFMDNTSDEETLRTKSDEIGKAIADGIDEYLGGSGGTSEARVRSIITPNEGKFLGTWKNAKGEFIEYYNPDGTVNEEALFDPEGKLVTYRISNSSDASPARRIETNEELLFELLQKSERTQQEEKLMRYLLFLYNGEDYGVTKFDFSIFDLNGFKRSRGGRITYETLNLTDEDMEILYKITSAERGDGTQEQQEYVVSVILNRVLSSYFPDTVRGVVFAPGQFEPISNGTYYSAIPSETTKAAVDNVVQNGDTSKCALYFMMPHVVAKQSWLSGPNIKFLFNDNNNDVNSHNFYTDTTKLDDLKQYMKGGGNGDILESCENIIELLVSRDSHYSQDFDENIGLGSSIEKAYNEHTRFCCATYVALVLYDAGLFTAEELESIAKESGGGSFNSCWGMSWLFKKAGWIKIDKSEAQPGDIGQWNGAGDDGHIYIYAGENLIYDQACAVTATSGTPPTLEPRPLWERYSAQSEEFWRAP